MEPEGDWSGPSGDDAEAGFPESPVIAIDEPVKVFLQLGRGYSVKGAEQKGLRFAMAVCTFGSHSSTSRQTRYATRPPTPPRDSSCLLLRHMINKVVHIHDPRSLGASVGAMQFSRHDKLNSVRLHLCSLGLADSGL